MTRDVFAELVEGFDALAAERQGKATLRSHKVQLGALATVSADELVTLRERLNMSRPVFAMYLRTNARTLVDAPVRRPPDLPELTAFGQQRLVEQDVRQIVETARRAVPGA
jgi:hypothetical protein